MATKTDNGLTVDELPRLTDEQRASLDDGYVAMRGVPAGEAPIAHTPGPWTTGKGNCHVVRVDKLNGMKIAECNNSRECDSRESFANARLIAAAPDMKAVLDDLEDSFDKEIYPEQAKEDYDAPDDREYTVTITAKQWRALGRALGKATGVA